MFRIPRVRETARILSKVQKIGPQARDLAGQLLARMGRPGQKALYGLSNLPRHYTCAQIEAACARVLASGSISYQSVKRILEHHSKNVAPAVSTLQADPAIRPIDDYQHFWELHSQHNHEDYHDADVDTRT
jgi:hypothetical protein